MTMMKPKDKGKDPATPIRVSGHEQPRPQIIEPPDGGWGWVVTFASFLCNVIVDGICLSYGSIKQVFEDHFGVTATASTLIGSLLTGSYLMIGPFASTLATKYGCRKVTIAGSIFAAAAFFISSFSSSIQMLIVTYGILGGIGFGFIYLPSIVIIGYWFEKKRAFATGVAVCGMGLGTFIFPPLTEYLLQKYNWQDCVIIISGLILNCAVCGALFRPVRPQTKRMKRGFVARGSIMRALIEEKKRQRTISNGSLDNCIITNDNRLIKLDCIGSNRSSIASYFQRSRSPHSSKCPSRSSLLPQNIVVESFRVDGTTTKPMSSNLLKPPAVPAIHSMDIPESNKLITNSVSLMPKAKSCDSLTPEDPWDKLSEEGSLSTRSLSYVGVSDSRIEINTPSAEASAVNSTSASPCESRCESRQTINTSNQEDPPKCYLYNCNSDLPPCLMGSSIVSIAKFQASIRSLESIYENNGHSRKLLQMFQEIIDLSLFRNLTFCVLLLSTFLSMLGFFIPVVYLPALAQQIGMNSQESSYLVSVSGVTNIVGRLLSGFLADRPVFGALHINNTALIMVGLCTIFCPFLKDKTTLNIYSGIYGLGVAAFVSLRSVLLVDLLGLGQLTKSFGLLTLFQGIATMAGLPLGGYLEDITGDVNATFYMSGVMLTLSGVISLPLNRLKKWQEQRDQGSPEEEPINDQEAKTASPSDSGVSELFKTEEFVQN
ncbi:monocarboxylate transporter 5-like [Octopus vulgaris]|uniref:Monocarboxylate transporter 5-like n=2 Tax=Octopus TaxID=6643 RepID=A0AA36FL06_OCTVU|nr:monocarboxylate transporter 13-like isoform X2 [Octopus sinensis]XP_036366873.1 monocarboxylate transporter 13-like isoform X3 [Octopus sinensis]CAI9737888.1 monocarboxylate transporter 5-like [Octopus vulgaris]